MILDNCNLELSRDSGNNIWIKRCMLTKCIDDLYLPDTLCINGIDEPVFGIAKRAFTCCEGIKEIHLPRQLKVIDDEAFYDLRSLQVITIPESVISIGEKAFEHCVSLGYLTIEGNVPVIGDRAFFRCYQLQYIKATEMIQIPESSYEDCIELQELILKEDKVRVDKNRKNKDFEILLNFVKSRAPKSFAQIATDREIIDYAESLTE